MSEKIPLPTLLTYDQARARLEAHPIRIEEVPLEHFVSLPLPTKRWRTPAWACFAPPPLQRRLTPTERSIRGRGFLAHQPLRATARCERCRGGYPYRHTANRARPATSAPTVP